MKMSGDIGECRSYIDLVKVQERSIGFVATMGALHDGHLSLIHASKADNDITIASVFVNPAQFNESSDYKGYPRDLARDIELLESAGCDALFSPPESEMYPNAEGETDSYWKGHISEVDLAPLDGLMEGKHRPGHFAGVIEIVQKLFYVVNPDSAYFGEKDYQQLAIISRMTELLDLGIDIVGCPIIREEDGLAMSSRNALLTREQRLISPVIHNSLCSAQSHATDKSIEELIAWITTKINTEPLCKVEYVEIVDPNDLSPLTNWDKKKKAICCLAVFIGSVRLIDNISLFH